MKRAWAKGRPIAAVLAVVGLALAVGCQRQALFTPALQATATRSCTATATPRPSETFTPSPTILSPATMTPPPTATPTVPPAGTATRSASTPTPTALPSATATASPTPSASLTPSPSLTPTETPNPFPTPDGIYREAWVPIFMYHYISSPPPGADEVRRDLSLTPERFEEHLRYFRDAGYTSIRMYDLVMYLQQGWPLPEKPVILSFDDGYADHYTIAFPLLRKYGFTGIFFIITGFLDERREGYLSWDQVQEMHVAGMEIGVHSYTHPDLRGQTLDYIVWQTLGPKQAVEAHTGQPAPFFCYPFGRYDEQVIAVVKSAHYWAGVTTHQGLLHTSERAFEIARVRVRGSDSPAELALKIEYLRQIAESATPMPSLAPSLRVPPTFSPYR